MTTKTWTPEEQAEHRKLWIEALRSGQYDQTAGALKASYASDLLSHPDQDVKYCCLGVACEISGLGEWYNDHTPVYQIRGEYTTDNCTTLPALVQAWLGLDNNNGSHVRGGQEQNPSGPNNFRSPISLATLNDSGHTFDEIADIIESEPEGLLKTTVQFQ